MSVSSILKNIPEYKVSAEMESKTTSKENSIHAFEDTCIISRVSDISTGSFSHCHVLTGHDPKTKYIFLAHITLHTTPESISEIFENLKACGVDLKNLTKVHLMGGSKGDDLSTAKGNEIISQLKKEGIEFNTDFYHKKENGNKFRYTPVPGGLFYEPLYTREQTHYNGGLLNHKTGKFTFFKKPWIKMEDQSGINEEKALNEFMTSWYKQHKVAKMPTPKEREIACRYLKKPIEIILDL